MKIDNSKAKEKPSVCDNSRNQKKQEFKSVRTINKNRPITRIPPIHHSFIRRSNENVNRL